MSYANPTRTECAGECLDQCMSDLSFSYHNNFWVPQNDFKLWNCLVINDLMPYDRKKEADPADLSRIKKLSRLAQHWIHGVEDKGGTEFHKIPLRKWRKMYEEAVKSGEYIPYGTEKPKKSLMATILKFPNSRSNHAS